MDSLAIDLELNARHDNQLQAGGCDDDVSVDLSAVGHRYSAFGPGLYIARDHLAEPLLMA